MVRNIVIGAGGLGFDSRAGHIERSVASDSPRLRCYFGVVLPRRYAAEMDPATPYLFRRNTASIMKIFLNFFQV